MSISRTLPRWILGIALIWTAAATVVSTAQAEEARAMRQLEPSALTVSRAASAKLDPRLLGAISRPDDSEARMRFLGGQLSLQGQSVSQLTYPILIQSELEDGELAALGAIPITRVGDVVTARVQEEVIRRLSEHPDVVFVEGSYGLRSTLDLSVPEVRANLVNQGPTGLTGDGVLYGLMDDGIDITHDDFRNGGGSRILFVWDQFEVQFPDVPYADLNYGAEYTKNQIDTGQASRFKNVGGHGSHVAGISVSNHPTFQGVAYESDIVAVVNGGCDLFCYGGAPPFPQSTVGAIDGLTYMKRKADELSRPLVINQSQGVTMGPHDGTTLYEQTYDTMIQAQNLIVCVAAGNDQTAGWHGRGTVPANGQISFDITHDTSQAQPLPTLRFEIWYDAGKTFNFQVLPPTGSGFAIPSDTGGSLEAQTEFGDIVSTYSDSSYPTNNQGYFFFFIVNEEQGAEPGVWTVNVLSENGSSGTVDLYLERNQHNFTVAEGQRSLEAIIGMPGSASEVITVGSYNTRLNWQSQDGPAQDNLENPVGMISTFSSNGPLRNGAQKPDLSAPGAWIAAPLSVDFEQQPIFVATDGVHTFFQGTSMATPHVAGAIALMLEKKPTLTYTEAKQILRNTARTDGFTGSVPNPAYGYGKLDVAAAVNAVDGGNTGCLGTTGDANGNATVDVVDIIAVVNHILGISTLGAEAQACVDTNGDENVSAGDIPGLVSIIMGGGTPARLASEPGEVAWRQEIRDDAIVLEFESSDIAALETAFVLPVGYRMTGDPVLRRAARGTVVSWSENLAQYKLIAYNARSTNLADVAGRLALEIPVERLFVAQELESFRPSGLRLFDPAGRELALDDEVLAEEPGSGRPNGIRSFLERTYPNPLLSVSQVEYNLAAGGRVELTVFDASGRQVRSLAGGWQGAGKHTVVWDGRDDRGTVVPDGVYFVRLATESGDETQKLTVVRR